MIDFVRHLKQSDVDHIMSFGNGQEPRAICMAAYWLTHLQNEGLDYEKFDLLDISLVQGLKSDFGIEYEYQFSMKLKHKKI